MKSVLWISVISLQLFWLSSCTMDQATRENVFNGMYNGTNQLHRYDNPSGISDQLPIGDQEPVPYEQYSQERRQEVKKDKADL